MASKTEQGVAAREHPEGPGPQGEGKYKEEIPGVIHKPLDEVKELLEGVTKGAVNKAGFVRIDYSHTLETEINKQIDFEISLAYTALAMGAYFDRDTVSLPGISKYFRSLSESEYSDADKFIEFQNYRGGRVQLMAVSMPDSDYYSADKGELYAFEIALALQKLNFDKLKALHSLADDSQDFQATDFIEDMMTEQAKRVKELGDLTCELKRVGKGHGIFYFDASVDKRFG